VVVSKGVGNEVTMFFSETRDAWVGMKLYFRGEMFPELLYSMESASLCRVARVWYNCCRVFGIKVFYRRKCGGHGSNATDVRGSFFLEGYRRYVKRFSYFLGGRNRS